jgi:hypothetical protein
MDRILHGFSVLEVPGGDWVLAGDDEEPPLRARVVRRDGDRVWVQLELPGAADAVA